MPPPLLKPPGPPQTLLGISQLSQGASPKAHHASLSSVLGFLVLSIAVIGLAALCLALARGRTFLTTNRSPSSARDHRLARHARAPRTATIIENARTQCLRRLAAASSSPSPKLRPLYLLGQAKDDSVDHQEVIKEQQRRRKRAQRKSEIFIPVDQQSFPFGSKPVRNAPLRPSRSCPTLQEVVAKINEQYPKINQDQDSLGVVQNVPYFTQAATSHTKTAQPITISSMSSRRASHPTVSTSEPLGLDVQRPSLPHGDRRRSKKNTSSQRTRRLQLASEAGKKRTLPTSRKRPMSHSEPSASDEDDVFLTPSVKKAPLARMSAKRIVPRKRMSRRKRASASSRVSSKQHAVSPRKPLGVLTNTLSSPVRSLPRLRPSLCINGVPASDVSTPPRPSRVRSPPRNKAYLSTHWRPQPVRLPRPALTITVFIKERSNRAMYPGRRMMVTSPPETSLTELRASIELLAGHKVGILKGMTIVGRRALTVPLISDRFYGQWVKERVAEGGIGVVEALKVDS